MARKGFGFLEILAPCTTGFGKGNDMRDARANWDWYKENSITRAELATLSDEERAANRKMVIGTLFDTEKPEFLARWEELVSALRKPAE